MSSVPAKKHNYHIGKKKEKSKHSFGPCRTADHMKRIVKYLQVENKMELHFDSFAIMQD